MISEGSVTSVEVWKELDKAIRRIVERVGKQKVIIWGMNYEGAFLLHLFRRYEIKFETWIDDSIDSFFYPVVRSNELGRLSSEKNIILITGLKNSYVEDCIKKSRFTMNENCFYAEELFYDYSEKLRPISYYDFLEYQYNVDILKRYKGKYVDSHNFAYSTGMRYAFVDLIEKLDLKKMIPFLILEWEKVERSCWLIIWMLSM